MLAHRVRYTNKYYDYPLSAVVRAQIRLKGRGFDSHTDTNLITHILVQGLGVFGTFVVSGFYDTRENLKMGSEQVFLFQLIYLFIYLNIHATILSKVHSSSNIDTLSRFLANINCQLNETFTMLVLV